jgi:hypothetical protein
MEVKLFRTEDAYILQSHLYTREGIPVDVLSRVMRDTRDILAQSCNKLLAQTQ